MSAPEMTLDFIKALLWPAVVVIGLFWLFRSQVKTLFEKVGNLFDRMRLQRVKTPGGLEFIFTALETAQAVVQDRVMEGRQAIVQAKDPEERERAVPARWRTPAPGPTASAARPPRPPGRRAGGWRHADRCRCSPRSPRCAAATDRRTGAWRQRRRGRWRSGSAVAVGGEAAAVQHGLVG